MAGKGKEAGTRAERLRAALTHEIDRCVAALQQADVVKTDVAGIDRHLRCVANAARAEKAAQSLIAKVERHEAEMSDDDRGHEPDDPVELERLHRELQSGVAEIHSVLEAKQREGWTFNPRAEADPRGPSETREASG